MRRLSITLSFAITAGLPHGQAQNAVASFDDVRSTLETYCVFRHTGKTAAAKVDLTRYDSPDKVVEALHLEPSRGSRDKFVSWVNGALREAACAGGLVPGPSPIRRVNRDEYSATIRDLLNIQIAAGHALPRTARVVRASTTLLRPFSSCPFTRKGIWKRRGRR